MTDQLTPLPCPFCGGTEVLITEGDNFRWRLAFCNCCGAAAGNVRCQTTGNGTKDEWEANAKKRAIEEWNRRAPIGEGK